MYISIAGIFINKTINAPMHSAIHISSKDIFFSDFSMSWCGWGSNSTSPPLHIAGNLHFRWLFCVKKLSCYISWDQIILHLHLFGAFLKWGKWNIVLQKQLSADIKIFNCKIKTNFVSPEMPMARANKNDLNIIIVHFFYS